MLSCRSRILCCPPRSLWCGPRSLVLLAAMFVLPVARSAACTAAGITKTGNPTTPPGTVVLQIPGSGSPPTGFVMKPGRVALRRAGVVMHATDFVFILGGVVLHEPGLEPSAAGSLANEPVPAAGVAVFVMHGPEAVVPFPGSVMGAAGAVATAPGCTLLHLSAAVGAGGFAAPASGAPASGLRIHLGQRRLEPGADLLRAADGPEVHEEEARRLGEHVGVERGDRDAVRAELAEDRIDLGGQEDEVAGRRHLVAGPLADALEVERDGHAHRGR